MSITPQQVQKLRETSGAGIMDCKKALEDSKGDFDKAIQFLREKGKATAAKRAGKATGQGIVCCWLDSNGKGSIVDINCETDFVARTKEMNDFTKELAVHTAKNSVKSVESLLSQPLGASKETTETLLKEKIGKTGENIIIKRLGCLGDENGLSLVGRYIHSAYENYPECGTLGVLVELQMDKNVREQEEVKALLGELCMQIAAVSPKWISKANVPADVVEKEKEIYKEQCRQSGKPEKAWDKIIEGKLNDFYKQFCLMEQSHVRDSSGKTSIQSLVQAAALKSGASLTIKNFYRFKAGEE